MEKCWREKVGRWIRLVGSHGPGWLGRRAIGGARFEVLMEESVVEGAVTDTEGLGGSLAPVVTKETEAGIEDGGGKKDKDAGGGDEDRGNSGEEGGE